MTATICLPKHYICNLYSTGFVPGPSNCVLQFSSERRARLAIGGTFFRSIGFGANQDNITVQCDWLDGGSIVTTNIAVMQYARLTVTDGLLTNTYTAAQTVDNIVAVDDVSLIKTITIQGDHVAAFPSGATFTVIQSTGNDGVYTVHAGGATLSGGDTEIPITALTLPSPIADGYVDITNAISSLRAQCSTNVFVTMPATDGIQPWSPSSDSTFIGHFVTTALGGGAPPAPSPSIRTGPLFTILYFTSTEDGGGNSVATNLIKYWNSQCWTNFTPTGDCYDPNNLPPGFCSLPVIC